MMQHPDGKPPDEMDELASSRSGSDRRQKSNAHVEQALNCPRCDSTNTKFCYYNNYSLTQPRYFCKNCRRYWTKGGALRNVPVGGGCRKNKRIKQRTMDPSSLVSLDETTSNLLARINTSNCTPLMPNFSAPSSSSFVDLGNTSHSYDLTFPLIQESIRLGGHAGSIHSPAASSPVTAGMLHSSCSQPSLLSSLTAMDTNLMNLSYPNSTVKTEHTGLYNGSSFSSLFETPAQMAAAPTAQLPSLEDQLSSTYSVPIESFNGCGVEAQLRSQQQKFALQLMNKGQVGDQGQILQNFEDETNENLRSIKGKAFLPCGGDGRSLSYWQGVPESLFETTGESSYWYSNPGWPDLHAIAGSAAGAML